VETIFLVVLENLEEVDFVLVTLLCVLLVALLNFSLDEIEFNLNVVESLNVSLEVFEVVLEVNARFSQVFK
jgi:hypothetical protein